MFHNVAVIAVHLFLRLKSSKVLLHCIVLKKQTEVAKSIKTSPRGYVSWNCIPFQKLYYYVWYDNESYFVYCLQFFLAGRSVNLNSSNVFTFNCNCTRKRNLVFEKNWLGSNEYYLINSNMPFFHRSKFPNKLVTFYVPQYFHISIDDNVYKKLRTNLFNEYFNTLIKTVIIFTELPIFSLFQ